MNGNSGRAAQDPLFHTARVAALHHELGVLIAAMSYAVNELAPYEQDTEHPRAARSLAVLKRALDEVTT